MTRMTSDIDHLSASSIRLYQNCPKQWATVYLDETPRRKGAALIKGSSVDAVATTTWIDKKVTGADIPMEDALAIAEETFRCEVDDAGGRQEIDWGSESFTDSLTSVIKMSERFMLDIAPLHTPEEVQLRLVRKLDDGRDLLGFIDAKIDDGHLADVKTGARRMSQKDADQDLQASAYAFLMGQPVKFDFLRVVHTSAKTRPYAETVSTKRSKNGLAWFEQLANDVSQSIDNGIYPATPGFWCSWCPINRKCIGSITRG